jgi:DNA helicase-2/ATP-dependent DNA helicase PcrA
MCVVSFYKNEYVSRVIIVSMISSKFQELYKKLNPRQKEAVDAIEGPVMVIAGPGTGKTSILTLRIANILRQTDTTPDSILALTFTESGVHSMRKKLVDIIGPAGYRVHIHTFHSFCNEIIKHFSQEFPRIIGAQHMTDVDQIRIIEEIITKTKLENLRPYGDKFYYLKPILSEIKNLKREDIDPKEFSRIIKDQEKSFLAIEDLYHEKGKYKGEMRGAYKSVQKKIDNNKELLLVYTQYQEKLEEEHLYDYEDMIMEVIRELKNNNDLLLELQETYQYVLADEHQDANNAQNKLLELISGFHESPNLFIVGDEKQAIFRFQGASLENFLYFKKNFPDAKLISLNENYRSTQRILDASFGLISNNKVALKDLRVELKASGESAQDIAKIYLHEFSSPHVEHEYIADKIKKSLDAGVDPSSIAILYRDNKDSAPIAQALEKRGVPFAVHSDSDLFADFEVQKFLTILRTVNEFGNSELLVKTLFVDFLHLDHLDVYKILRQSYQDRISIYDAIKSRSILKKYSVENIEAFISLYNTLHMLSVRAKNKSLIESIEDIQNEFKYTDHLVSLPDAIEKLEVFDTLLSQIITLVERHKSYKLEDYINFLVKLNEHGIFSKAKTSVGLVGKVHLMTAHKSKGLEFDTVYVTGLTDGHWGSRRSPTYFDIWMFRIDKEDHQTEDERRLLYVAITRARKEVLLSYSNKNESGKELLPTQYISEIDGVHIESVSVDFFEDKFKKERMGSDLKKVKPKTPDQAYLREQFFEQGLSVSALNNYLRCPWQFVFLNLLRIPKAQERHQLYGTAIHETLKVFFDEYKNEKKMTKKVFLETFKNFLNRKALSQEDFDLLLEKGQETLSGYYDTYQSIWNKNVINELNIAGVFLSLESNTEKNKQLLLKGNLDKVEISSDGSVIVVDYKTGAPKSRGHIQGTIASSDGDYYRQLVFYKLLLDRFDGGKFKMRAGEIDFIEPTEKDEYKKEKFEIADEDVLALEKEICRVAHEISEFTFWNDKCDDPKCEYCALSKYLNK